MRKKLILFTLLLFSSITFSIAQIDTPEEKGNFFDRVYLGGSFNLGLGTVTFIDISPLFGYMITDRLSAGPGFVYQYFKIRGFEADHIYGPRGFVRFNLSQQVFAYSEVETLNIPTSLENRVWVPGLFLGGGFFQPVGRRSGVMVMALYNVLYDFDRSPYPRPFVIRMGFTF